MISTPVLAWPSSWDMSSIISFINHKTHHLGWHQNTDFSHWDADVNYGSLHDPVGVDQHHVQCCCWPLTRLAGSHSMRHVELQPILDVKAGALLGPPSRLREFSSPSWHECWGFVGSIFAECHLISQNGFIRLSGVAPNTVQCDFIKGGRMPVG